MHAYRKVNDINYIIYNSFCKISEFSDEQLFNINFLHISIDRPLLSHQAFNWNSFLTFDKITKTEISDIKVLPMKRMFSCNNFIFNLRLKV